MGALRIEILNPKALKLINGMQELKLIKVSEEPASKLKAYLKKTRKNASSAPTEDEIAKIVGRILSCRKSPYSQQAHMNQAVPFSRNVGRKKQTE
jgi:hypothetical protein